MNRAEVILACSEEEAKAMRTALHIAARLCLHLPDGLKNKEWGTQFRDLHMSLVDNGVDILEGAPEFSDRVMAKVGRSLLPPLVSADFSDIEARVGAALHADLMTAYGRPSGGKTMYEQAALIDALMAASRLTPRPGPFTFGYGTTVTGSKETKVEGVSNIVPPMRRWKVQFNNSFAVRPYWRDIGELKGFVSRNEAYRRMHARAQRIHRRANDYRVVPQGTPEGEERDRGFYTVEFLFKDMAPGFNGWRASSRPGLHGTFPSADDARKALAGAVTSDGKQREKILRSYRIKWHQSKP